MVLARWSRLRVSQLAFCRHSARKSFSAWFLAWPATCGVIDLVDQHPRQRLGVELDLPAAVAGRRAPRRRQRSRRWRRRRKRHARARIERADFGQHVEQILLVDAADPLQRREIAARQQIEIARAAPASPDRSRSRWLSCSARHSARSRAKMPGRIERLADGQHRRRHRFRRRQAARRFRPSRPADSRPRRARRPARARSAAPRDRQRRRRSARRHGRASVTRRGRHVVHVEAVRTSRLRAVPRRRLPLRGRDPARAVCVVPGSSGKMFSSEAVELRRRSPRRRGRIVLGNQSVFGRASPRASRFCSWSVAASSRGSARSSSGLRSISSSTKRSSSRWVSCSSRIDCISCGVITSDCDCRSCSLAASAMVGY